MVVCFFWVDAAAFGFVVRLLFCMQFINRLLTTNAMREFVDRADAGHQLAAKLLAYRDRPDVVVLGVVRGGLPVAFEVASDLHAPLDIVTVRKLGTPGHEELAMGAIADGGVKFLNQDLISMMRISSQEIDQVEQAEQRELQRRERVYRGNRPPVEVANKTAIIVDDGIATGATIRAAIASMRAKNARQVIVATPVGAADTCAELRQEGNTVISVMEPLEFSAVGLWYQRFPQTSDSEVHSLLAVPSNIS
jgi:putative phosphoribosyl transferase